MEYSMTKFEIVGFDADDTLWINESYYRSMEDEFYLLMQDYLGQDELAKELLQTEIRNIPIYGFGVKSFTLSMIETAIKFSGGKIAIAAIQHIVDMGKAILNHPVELIDDVKGVLQTLNGRYKLILVTKGDLLHQEKKLKESSLEEFFDHIEIVSDKTEQDYQKLISHLDIPAEKFLMIGNSLKSDVLPVLNIGGHAYHVPYQTTWELEKVHEKIDHPNFKELSSIKEVLDLSLIHI